jgi:succinate dehydrogenase / fumarate reductase membrane anchor subunit
MTTTTRRVKTTQTYEKVAFRWMRISAILLIPLVWIHIVLQDIIVGVHDINADYVAVRWGLLVWQVYDILLLGFAFAHGVNGLRQVINDFIHNQAVMRVINIALVIFWAALTIIGAVGIVFATRSILFQ